MTARKPARRKSPARPRKNAKTTEQRQAQAAELKARLEQFQADADPAVIAMALATHDGYSDRNAMLIAAQDPEATDVRGYRAWQDAGRQVGSYPEGEHGIVILGYRGDNSKDAKDAGPADAPAPAEAAEAGAEGGTDKISRFFSPVTVHDYRHTFALTCGAETDTGICGLPIHRAGYDTEAKRHNWIHTGGPQAGHEARLPARTPAASV